MDDDGEELFCPDSLARLNCLKSARVALRSTGDPFTSDQLMYEAAKLLEWVDHGCFGLCQACMREMSNG